MWVPVWVRVEDPSIERVYCLGDFNNWGVAVPLAPVRERLFAGEVQMAPGRWKYGFVGEHSQPLVGGFAETLDMGREAFWCTDPLTPTFSFPGRGPREYHSVEIGDPTPRVRVLEEDVSCVVEDAPSAVPAAHLRAAKQCLPPDWFGAFWRDHYDRDEGGPRNLLIPTVWNNPERMLTRGEMLAWVNQVGDIAEGDLYPLVDPTTGEYIDEDAEEDEGPLDPADDTSRIEPWELDDNPFAQDYREDGSRVEFAFDPETDAVVAAHIFAAFPEVNNSVLPDVRRRLLSHLLGVCGVAHDEGADADTLALRYRVSVAESSADVKLRELVPDVRELIVAWSDALLPDVGTDSGAVTEEDEDPVIEDEDDEEDEEEAAAVVGDDALVARELGLDEADDSLVVAADTDEDDEDSDDDEAEDEEEEEDVEGESNADDEDLDDEAFQDEDDGEALV